MWLIGFVVVLIIWLGFYIEESIMHYLTGVSILDQIKKWLRIHTSTLDTVKMNGRSTSL